MWLRNSLFFKASSRSRFWRRNETRTMLHQAPDARFGNRQLVEQIVNRFQFPACSMEKTSKRREIYSFFSSCVRTYQYCVLVHILIGYSERVKGSQPKILIGKWMIRIYSGPKSSCSVIRLKYTGGFAYLKNQT